MLRRKKTKIKAQKLKKKIVAKSKTTAKRKITVKAKATPKKKLATKKVAPKRVPKITEPISFGLLQDEVDKIIAENNNGQSSTELNKAIMKELAQILPKTETIMPIKIASHTDIIVQSANDSEKHSPYVLDLTSMVEKKKHEAVKKYFVREFFHNQNKKDTPQVLIYQETKPVATELHETHIVIADPVRNKPKATKEKLSAKRYAEQFTDTPLFYHFNLPLNWHRSILIYLAICLLVVIPIKTFGYYSDLKKTQFEIMDYANTAYQDLKLASVAIAEQNVGAADEGFGAANQNFGEAVSKVDSINIVIKSIINLIPGDQAKLADAEYLLRAGKKISAIGADLTSLLDSFTKDNNKKLTDRITLLQVKLSEITPKLDEINNDLNKVNVDALPTEKQASFTSVKKYFSLVLSDVKELNSLSNTFNQILGKDYKRRYLFVFQNNNELRATGGFLGSFALVDIDRGGITNIEIPGGGTYDMQGGLLEKKISPYPLQLIKSTWQMQDANWFPDFPTSAQKIKWFYEKSGGPSVDGVIAINASILPKLLAVTGPVAMPEYGKTLTTANFMTETQKTVEYDYDKTTNKPKQILSDLAPKIIEKLFSSSGADLLKVAGVFKESLTQKDIQLYFTDAATEQSLTQYNWTGEIKDTSKDFLEIVNSNIGGYKTDAYVTSTADLVSEINDQGEITNTLNITRTHNGSSGDLFGDKTNIDYLRVYVPENSKLLSATGFTDMNANRFEPVPSGATADEFLAKTQGEIWVDKTNGLKINNEFDKTVFGSWLELKPGETKTVTLKYRLPFTLKLNQEKKFFFLPQKSASTFHSLYVQKQSGSQKTQFNITIKLPSTEKMSWTYPGEAKARDQELTFTTPLDEDKLIAFVVE